MSNLDTGATKTPKLEMIHMIEENSMHGFTRENHFEKE